MGDPATHLHHPNAILCLGHLCHDQLANDLHATLSCHLISLELSLLCSSQCRLIWHGGGLGGGGGAGVLRWLGGGGGGLYLARDDAAELEAGDADRYASHLAMPCKKLQDDGKVGVDKLRPA